MHQPRSHHKGPGDDRQERPIRRPARSGRSQARQVRQALLMVERSDVRIESLSQLRPRALLFMRRGFGLACPYPSSAVAPLH